MKHVRLKLLIYTTSNTAVLFQTFSKVMSSFKRFIVI